MPHTNRPSKSKNRPPNQQKRLQVTDSSGWTHVTTTTSARARRLFPQNQTQTEEELHPAEAPKDLTLPALQAQFTRHHERWLASGSWGVVQDVLLASRTDTGVDAGTATIGNIVSISLGSFSGFLRGGWVDRRAVSMDQLAALVSIRDILRIPAYTQDPVYNALDKALLAALDITVVDDPEAFDLVSVDSFAYCPGAERAHLETILARMPRGLFGGPVEEMVDSSEIGRRFLGSRTPTRVPAYEPDEKAFYGMRVYL